MTMEWLQSEIKVDESEVQLYWILTRWICAIAQLQAIFKVVAAEGFFFSVLLFFKFCF